MQPLPCKIESKLHLSYFRTRWLLAISLPLLPEAKDSRSRSFEKKVFFPSPYLSMRFSFSAKKSFSFPPLSLLSKITVKHVTQSWDVKENCIICFKICFSFEISPLISFSYLTKIKNAHLAFH